MDTQQSTSQVPETQEDTLSTAAGAPPSSPTDPVALATMTSTRMVVFTIVCVGMMATAYQATLPTIEASLKAEKLKLINEILPPSQYDNDLLSDEIMLPPLPDLGNNAPVSLYRARHQESPVGIVLEATAADGYSGEINLVIAVKADGTLSGVRVSKHKETPGLGDYIDPNKDKNKNQSWINQFTNLHFADLKAHEFTVKKDGGIFAYHAGATISARAVSRAVGRAIRWVHTQQDTLFSLPNGSTFTKVKE